MGASARIAGDCGVLDLVLVLQVEEEGRLMTIEQRWPWIGVCDGCGAREDASSEDIGPDGWFYDEDLNEDYCPACAAHRACAGVTAQAETPPAFGDRSMK